MSQILTNVEASFYRYLYENLTVPHGIPVFEDPFSTNYEDATRWVVIDTLSNRLGDQPVQLLFLHLGQRLNAPSAKEAQIRLVDQVTAVLDEGTEIPLYDYASGDLIGAMEVVGTSLQPSMKHRSGGSYRPLTVKLAYPNI